MPRDANGLYSLPLPAVAAGTTITTLWGNTTTEDLASAMTGSLSRAGEGGMLAPLRLVDGSLIAPGLGFVTEVGLGMYKSADGIFNFVANGNQMVRFSEANQMEVWRDKGGGAQWYPVSDSTDFNAHLLGYELGGLHTGYAADLDDITFNSLYSFKVADVANEPPDLAGTLAIVETNMWATDTTQAVQVVTGMDVDNVGQSFVRIKETDVWTAWKPFSGGGGLAWNFPVADFTAESNKAYMFSADLSITQVTLPLLADLKAGDSISLSDLGDTWDGTINVDGNGETIEGLNDLDLQVEGSAIDFVWTGTEWEIIGLVDGVYRGATPPAAPQAVGRWWDTDLGRSYIWYDDGDSSQWVEAEPPGAVDATPLEIFINGVPVDSSLGQISIDFTIPAGVKQIRALFSGLSSDEASDFLVQIGDSGVPASAGYGGRTSVFSASTLATSSARVTGVHLHNSDIGSEWTGQVVLNLMDAATNLWTIYSIGGSESVTKTDFGMSTITLAGVLDILRITSFNGTALFDAGTVNIQYDNPGQLPNIVPPGTVVQVQNFQTGALNTGTTIIPSDDTIPQITEGDEYMSLEFTPKFADSLLRIDVVAALASTSVTSSALTAAVFKDAIADALGINGVMFESTFRTLIGFTVFVAAGSTDLANFTVRAGSGVTGTTTFNGFQSGPKGGGSMASSITITEIAQ